MRCFSIGLLVLAAVLAGCESGQKLSSYQEIATPITLTPKQVASVRAGVSKGFAGHDLRAANVGRMLAGRTSTSVVVCGYVSGKNSAGESVPEIPFHGLFMGFDNASGFVVTGIGGSDIENSATFEDCRHSGLDISRS